MHNAANPSITLRVVKKLAFLSGLLSSLVLAEESNTESGSAGFASDWRVTAFVRQGQRAEASLERPGGMPRFVRVGDKLPGEISVLEISYQERSVTLGKGKDSVVLRPETAMAAPAAQQLAAIRPPTPVPVAQNLAVKSDAPAVQKPTAMQDASGRWVVAFPNGKSLDMNSYVERHGGVAAAMEHVRGQLEKDTNPERQQYRQQQLHALEQMSKTSQ